MRRSVYKESADVATNVLIDVPVLAVCNLDMT